jgi:hypothetical protein
VFRGNQRLPIVCVSIPQVCAGRVIVGPTVVVVILHNFCVSRLGRGRLQWSVGGVGVDGLFGLSVVESAFVTEIRASHLLAKKSSTRFSSGGCMGVRGVVREAQGKFLVPPLHSVGLAVSVCSFQWFRADVLGLVCWFVVVVIVVWRISGRGLDFFWRFFSAKVTWAYFQ